MISGGYHGTRSFHGYMGRVQLYRHFDLSHTTFVKSKYLPDTRRDLQNWKFRQHYRRCEVIRKTVYRCLGIVDNQGKCTQSTWWDRKEQQAPVAASVNKTRYILNSRLTRLVRNLAEELDLNKLLTLNDIAEKVHEFALKQLVSGSTVSLKNAWFLWCHTQTSHSKRFQCVLVTNFYS